MEALEKEQNIETDAKNPETLKGFEGHVFDNIVFEPSKNSKGKITFKSSAPDRKIIVLSPFSEVPKEGVPLKVLVVRDTDPDNPMKGKLVATLLKEEEVLDPKALAIEMREEFEGKRNESILTPEDRERIAALLKKCEDYYITSDPYYDEYEDGYFFDEGGKRLGAAKRNAVIKKRQEEQRAKADMVIELRRQLRAEGSKAVLYILEYGRSPNPNAGLLYKYSEMLYFAASPKDAKNVCEFFSTDAIAKDPYRSVKDSVRPVMGRICTAADVDSLKNLLDRMFQSPYRNRAMAGYDANRIAEVLVDIKGKTTNTRDIEKIDEAVEYVKKKVEKIGGVVIVPHPEDPKGLQESYEEKFLDIELRDGINDFINRWTYHNVRTEVSELKKVLEKYGASEMLPALVHKVYWGLLRDAYRYNGRPRRFEEAMQELQSSSGIALDYQAFEPEIQGEYESLLQNLDSERILLVKNLYDRSHIKYKGEPETIQKKYLEIVISDRSISHDLVSVLKEVTGIEPDFHSVEKQIQEIYKSTILGLGRSLKKAELLYEATEVRPQIDPAQMQEKYRELMRENSEPMPFIMTARNLTGIEPDFSGMEDLVQTQYARLFYLFATRNPDQIAGQFNALKNISHVTPLFSKEEIGGLYFRHILEGRLPTARIMLELAGVTLEEGFLQQRLNEECFTTLTRFRYHDLDNALRRVERIQGAIGLRPFFSEEEKNQIFQYAMRILRESNDLPEILKLEKIFPNPESLTKVLGEILLNSLEREDRQGFADIREKMKALGTTFGPGDLTAFARRHASDNPRRLLNILKFLEGESQGDDLIFFLQKTLSHDPWVAAFLRLEKIQGTARNVANDPWENELRPFIREVFDRRIISINREEDAELVVSFVNTMGMNNLPQIFAVYADCQRNKNMQQLLPETIELCEQFGIKTCRKNGSWRFKSPLELFNALSEALRGMQTKLLNDKIPEGLQTELGAELFNRIKGSTQFERDYSLSSIIEQWKETVRRAPALAELPPGFQEATIQVPILKQKIEVTRDQSEQLEKLLAGQEVADVYMPLAQSFELAREESAEYLLGSIARKLEDEEAAIRGLLVMSPKEMEQMIADEADPKEKQSLVKKSKALQNPKGRQGMERQADILKGASEEVGKIYETFAYSFEGDADYVVALEELNKVDGKVPLGKEIREFSAFHMRQVMGGGTLYMLDNLLSEGVAPTPERIYGIHKIARDYIEEHYLHHLQDPLHTEHAAFSPELMEKLMSVWAQQLDKDGRLPITILKNKLDRILNSGSEKQSKEMAIAMVPVSGLFNIFSGDLGDSCHTSQHEALARGNFPNIRSWAYVANRNRENEQLKGSVLAILAERLDGDPVLVVRANNPAENFIQTVDHEVFVMGALREAVETARRARAERMKGSRSLPTRQMRQMVAIPMDQRGMASTNRQRVNDVYRSRFSQCKIVKLKNTADTNFNSYNVHGGDFSNTPSVVIWEIDEDGNEKWHGNWR